MRAHMSKPTTASRMVVISPSCDACGRRESCFCARSRVGGWTWWFPGPRRISQLPWSSIRFFCRSSHLPYTSSNFKRPPRLGGRWQRGVPYTVAIISSRCIDWCPPIGGGGHGWRDAPVGSTFSEIQLTIALSCQPNHRPRGFSRFSRLPWSKIDLPCTKFHLPWSKINLPYTRYIFFSPSLTRLPCTGLTYPVPKLTYPIPEISFSPSQTQLP